MFTYVHTYVFVPARCIVHILVEPNTYAEIEVSTSRVLCDKKHAATALFYLLGVIGG